MRAEEDGSWDGSLVARLENFYFASFGGNVIFFFSLLGGEKWRKRSWKCGRLKIYAKSGRGSFLRLLFMASYPGAQAGGSRGASGGDWRLIGTGH